MAWGSFGIPGSVRTVASGIGSVFGRQFDLKAEIDHCNAKLAEDDSVLEVLMSAGWKKMCTEYKNVIEMQKATINALNQDTKRNVEEIQRRRDLQFACELWLQAVQAIKVNYDETANRLNHYTRVAQSARPAS